MDTSAVFLLQCMAVVDSLLLATSFWIYTLTGIYPYTNWLEEMYKTCHEVIEYVWPVAMMAHTATIYLTVLVSLNRYFAICHAVSCSRMYGLPVVRIQVIAVLCFSVAYNIPRFLEHKPLYGALVNVTDGSNQTVNETVLGDNQLYQIIYSNVLYFPVMYIVPLLSLAFLNYKLIQSLKRIQAKKQSLTGQRQKEDHITVCVIALVCVFVLCQTPALVNQIFWAAIGNEDRVCGTFHFYYTKISDVLVVLNSSCNFVIYCLFGKTFRRIFIQALCRYRLGRLDTSNASYGGTTARLGGTRRQDVELANAKLNSGHWAEENSGGKPLLEDAAKPEMDETENTRGLSNGEVGLRDRDPDRDSRGESAGDGDSPGEDAGQLLEGGVAGKRAQGKATEADTSSRDGSC